MVIHWHLPFNFIFVALGGEFKIILLSYSLCFVGWYTPAACRAGNGEVKPQNLEVQLWRGRGGEPTKRLLLEKKVWFGKFAFAPLPLTWTLTEGMKNKCSQMIALKRIQEIVQCFIRSNKAIGKQRRSSCFLKAHSQTLKQRQFITHFVQSSFLTWNKNTVCSWDH